MVCVVMMVIAGIFEATSLICIKFLMKTLNTTPAQVNTAKGVSGICICAALYLPIYYALELVLTDITMDGFVFELQNGVYLGFCILLVTDLCLYNFFMVMMLQNAEPISVCTIDSARVIIIWVIQTCVSFKTEEIADLAGGLFIVLGALFYNGVIVLPINAMKESVKRRTKRSTMYVKMRDEKKWVFLT